MDLGQRLGERQAEAGAVAAAGERGLHLAEGLEHLFHLIGRNADAGIGDLDDDAGIVVDRPAQRHAAALRREFQRVGQEVEEDLLELALIGDDAQRVSRRRTHRQRVDDAHAGRLRPLAHQRDGRAEEIAEGELRLVERQLAELDL